MPSLLKTISAFLFVAFFASSATARCSSNGVAAFPADRALGSNGVLVLEGYSMTQSFIESLEERGTVWLTDGSGKFGLEAIELNKGAFQLTQVVLKPNTGPLGLPAGTYRLQFVELESPDPNHDHAFNDAIEQLQKIDWTVSSLEDETAPAFTEAPAHTDNTFQLYGCGPDIHSVFSMKAEHSHELLVRAEVENMDDAVSSMFILPLGTTTLGIGHGMCSGAFKFVYDARYRARFRLLDAFGNQTAEWSEWVEFDSPQPKKVW